MARKVGDGVTTDSGDESFCLIPCIGVVYYILIVDRTNYTTHIVYNLLHVMLDDNLLLYGPQIVMYYLYVYDAVESGIKQLN